MASKNSTKVETEKHSRGPWRERFQVDQDKVRNFEAALGVFGPEIFVRRSKFRKP